ncbi:toxic anion resistance family protein [Candidatus Puniceispirillum marinum IMCC1322]|uniref:Toxic anion resistance family protein n=2 Tax=Candidatus Puniceispirillum TaxID=767891 RepID=D5BRS3_PUNMI|nr:toxic anion resistance family protein [Candidatus Puniceispirillum marinum IMCC1322]
MVDLGLFKAILRISNAGFCPVVRSFEKRSSRVRSGMFAIAIAVMSFGYLDAADSSDIRGHDLYIKIGDVVTYVPITQLKEKSKLQIIDIVGSAVERTIHELSGLSSDQINQARVIAKSDVFTEQILMRVQLIYKQAAHTGIDIETLVKLDNVFAANDLTARKAADMVDTGGVMGAQEGKSLAVQLN